MRRGDTATEDHKTDNTTYRTAHNHFETEGRDIHVNRCTPAKPELGEINKYNFRTETTGVFKAQKGLNRDVVNQISDIKDEPDWMREFRLRSLEIFESKPMPKWGGAIDIDFQDIYYYLKPTEQQGEPGTTFLRKSRTRSTSWEFPKPKRSSWPG